MTEELPPIFVRAAKFPSTTAARNAMGDLDKWTAKRRTVDLSAYRLTHRMEVVVIVSSKQPDFETAARRLRRGGGTAFDLPEGEAYPLIDRHFEADLAGVSGRREYAIAMPLAPPPASPEMN